MNQSSDLFCCKIKRGWYFKAMSEVQRQVSDSQSFKAEIWRMNRKYMSKTAKVFLAASRVSDIPEITYVRQAM